MTEGLAVRRHLYEQLAAARVASRRRRALRRQIAVLTRSGPDPDGGAAGVREPRRPVPPAGPAIRRAPVR